MDKPKNIGSCHLSIESILAGSKAIRAYMYIYEIGVIPQTSTFGYSLHLQ